MYTHQQYSGPKRPQSPRFEIDAFGKTLEKANKHNKVISKVIGKNQLK